MNFQKFSFILLLIAAFPTFAGLGQGKVHLVLGSDTAIWEGMNVAQYHNYYNFGLYTDPQRNAYLVMDPGFRSGIVDSYGTPLKLTWWMMAGNIFRYATNRNIPVPNIMTLHLMKRFHMDAIQEYGDELSLHYHTFDWFDYSGDGKFWWNQTETFMQLKDDWDFTLAQFLLEEDVFPVSFRSGWHYMDNEWQAVLDELLPYSMHNDWPAKRKDTTEPLDNTFDWSRASAEFVPYRPAPGDYQVPGDGKGWNVRSLFFGRVTQQLMDDIFEKADQGVDQVVCFWAHLPETDFLDNILKINEFAHAADEKYPDVTFRYTTAVEAMQRWRDLYGEPPPFVTLEDVREGETVRLRVSADKPIFQTVPFVAIKDVFEDYRIVPMVQSGPLEWISEDGFPLRELAKAGVAVTDTTGNLRIAFIQYLPDDVYFDVGEAGYSEPFGVWQSVQQKAWFQEGRAASIPAGDSAAVYREIPIEHSGRYNIFMQIPDPGMRIASMRFQILDGEKILAERQFPETMPVYTWNFVSNLELMGGSVLSLKVTGFSENGATAVFPAPVLKLSALVRDRDIHIEPQFVDLGEVSEGDTVRVDVSVINRGIEPLEITDVRSVENTLRADIELPLHIPPMDQSIVRLSFYSGEVAPVLDTIVVSSNDPRRPEFRIPFSADVQTFFIVIDNEDSLRYREQGAWHTSVAQAHGPSSRYSFASAVHASAHFTAILPYTGIYDLYQIVPTTVNSVNRALYILSIEGVDADSVHMDQNLGSGAWVNIMRSELPANVEVEMRVVNDGTNTSGDVLRADAIKFALYQEITRAGKEGTAPIPETITLYQNYPNPYNPTTRISFSVPEQIHTSLIVFDMLGREVAVLVDELKPAGHYDYTFDAGGLPSGLYFYRLLAGSHSETKRMMLVR